ncbi:DUF3750 domain-containing protein [Aliidiomarina iranensis]|uniref:DUF3750 domain-containing protein n=1 Tax=Aliidiomarina iranensis TaxID=1434071 RepID=A0A432VQN4_9GAMM|nr:DUF3750 domain-containing protein [Aliidiomarina iranensis]RUO18505.1 DUF3750 domain-containing protein [Aliidiomarina iranensis]
MKRALPTILAFLFVLTACSSGDWRDASREPAGLAPSPVDTREAVIEVYAADAFGWRGWFAVHTWIAVKPENAEEYTVFEVVGWGVDEGRPALRTYQTKTPDRYWYGARPEVILSLQGANADSLIPRIEQAVISYPWADQYRAVPGPNSNTLPAWIGLQVPELGLELPFSAIGSGYANRGG